MYKRQAYSRAVRAHSLVLFSLIRLVLREISISNDEQEAFNKLSNIYNDDYYESSPELCEKLKNFHDKFYAKMEEINKRSRTAALWVQYIKMVLLLKLFIVSERSGNCTYKRLKQ